MRYVIELSTCYEVEAEDKDEAVSKAVERFDKDVLESIRESSTADFGMTAEVVEVRDEDE